jgi:PIN domain nuclease of toxin-antitoxin system
VASLLLDTCTFLWLTAEPSRLSAAAAEALDDETNALSISDVSALEIALKWSVRKLKLPHAATDLVRISSLDMGVVHDRPASRGHLPRDGASHASQ